MEQMNQTRRRVLKTLAGGALLGCVAPRIAFANSREISLGNATVHTLSDGEISLPVSRLFSTDDHTAEGTALLSEAGFSTHNFSLPLNVTLLQSDDRLVLFDLGSGAQFMDSTGLLPAALESLEIDPADVTDVVFTHAHPDHCWGLLDDFDDLLCADATYHIHGAEFDYWLAEDTLNNADDASLGVVAGARNRLPLIEEQLNRFAWGDEILPGIEAVDSHGHTPGHTSFAVHNGSDSLMVLGDALIHPVLSFQRPDWPWSTDQDPDAAVATRKRLLDRLHADNMQLIGYHLPGSGVGMVEQLDGEYRFNQAG